MNELHLFAGAGGGILGGHLLGHSCVCAVEWNPYARRVLLARQRDGVLPRFPIWDDVQTFDGKPWRGRVDVVAGGFPCQDISSAGKGAGIDGAKSGMWRHMARIVSEVRPRFVFVENSPMLTSRGLGVVLGDLAAMGYDAEWCVLGAADAGAPHLRERIWILGALADAMPAGERRDKRQSQNAENASANTSSVDWHSDSIDVGTLGNVCNRSAPYTVRVCKTMAYASSRRRPPHQLRARRYVARLCGQDVADSVRDGSAARFPKSKQWQERQSAEPINGSAGSAGSGDWWCSEPPLGRVANGVAHRVDRLTAIGNGQVPAVAALAWRTLMARIESR